MPRCRSDSRSPERPRICSKREESEWSDRRNYNYRQKYRTSSRDRDERPRKRRSVNPRSDSEGRQGDATRRYRKRSPRTSEHKHRHRSRSISPQVKALVRSRGPLPSQDTAFGIEQDPEKPIIDKQKPNFGPSGKLAAASNTVQTAGQTIILKYHEPLEARKPPARDAWRLYIFKNNEIKDTVELLEQSCWLFGREMAVVDVPIEHPSASKQHAVIQFRYLEKRNEFGDKVGKVKPYVLDLESSNGTYVNEERIPEAKYIELKDKDVIKFGQSRREYVIQLPAK